MPTRDPLILAVTRAVSAEDDLARACKRAKALGFDHVLINGLPEWLAKPKTRAARGGVGVLVRLRLDHFELDHPAVAEMPEAFAVRRANASERPVDPRRPSRAEGVARARLRWSDAAEFLRPLIGARLKECLARGVAGIVVDQPDGSATDFYRALLGDLRAAHPEARFIAATPGLPREAATALASCGFDYVISSLGWWDMRESWLVEEYEALRPAAPLLAEISPDAARRAADPAAAERLMRVAAVLGDGIIVPDELVERTPEFAKLCKRALQLAEQAQTLGGRMLRATSATAPVTAIVKSDAWDLRAAEEAALLLINPSLDAAASLDGVAHAFFSGLPMQDFVPLDTDKAPFEPLAPGEARVLSAKRAKTVIEKVKSGKNTARAAAVAPRLVVETLSPSVEGGDFAVKRVIGDVLDVTADIYGDGHEQLAAELQWRALDEKTWQAVRMEPEGNDVWSASFRLERMGRHEYAIEAWLDRFGGFRRDFGKKVDADVAQYPDFLEGQHLIEEARERSSGKMRTQLDAVLRDLEAAKDDAARAAILRAQSLADLMDAADDRRFALRSEPQKVDAERLAARFSSWYELFPRSITDSKKRHGTFRDVIGRLPAVREMGFDTLYFPPVHPIGKSNRKGPNNTLTPSPTDPGSPYAIGSDEGGYEAIHPELGSFEDFAALVDAARDEGLEIALDFAINCSPDHPWLKQHPGWFAWRADGSIKYAENPPKKYQDIVNVDWYAEAAVPDLWIAMRDVILLWVKKGVKTFRVDNPHTKPLPFWEWMIGEVRSAHPEVIFLSEAFTKPKVMYRLAKVGFSQSYTYFTWRDTKAELTEYITELTTTAPREFFRPHFFVNTPDINPIFLQTSGRAGFQIRAALAATLSGLFGVYSGFELCESAPLPGREEYLDSEKFEIRPRDYRAPGNIIWDITLLNQLRRSHPALQTHLNTVFYNALNDNIIYYGKPAPDGGDMILVAINLDPQNAQEADFELPTWRWGLPDHAAMDVEDLATKERFTWHGKSQHMRLEPSRPYRLWKIEPARTRNV